MSYGCAVLPADRFVSYDLDDLEWMIPLGMAEVAQLPESLVKWFAQRASESLFNPPSTTPSDDFTAIGFEACLFEPDKCEACHNVRPLYFGDKDFFEPRDGRYLCAECLRLRVLESLQIPTVIIESAESSSYSSASANLKQWETG